MDNKESKSKSHIDDITPKSKLYSVNRYQPKEVGVGDDPMPDYMNLLAMIFSMCGLLFKIKWCAWFAVLCSLISFTNSRSSDDSKQVLSSFMLSISAVVMAYLQNPAPMTPPW